MKSKYFKIVFFTQFSKKIGFGHYVRSKRLYDFLKTKYQTYLYVNKNNIFISNYLKDNSVKTIFIFDFKNYQNHNYKVIKNFFYIYFDSNLNQNKYSLNINPLIPTKKYYSGPRWFSYPEKFFLQKQNKKKSPFKKILLCQGGTDANNNITSLIKTIKNKIQDIEFELNVLIPKTYKIQKNNFPVKYHQNIKDMGKFINKFDYIVTSCGLLSFEINFFGLNCTYVTSEPREIKLAKYFQKKGFGKYFKISQRQELLNNIYKNINEEQTTRQLKNKIRYFKHNGLKNISKLILNIKNEI